MPKYSLAGTPFFNGPGKYYDQADMERRGNAAQLSDLVRANPSMDRKYQGEKPDAGYLTEGLAYDVEGLLSAYALKFGQDRAMKLMDALPHLNTRDLLEVQRSVSGAARESMDMGTRERNTYERNDALYPPSGGQ